MRIVLIGPKCTGKTIKGKKIAQRLDINFFDTDKVLEEIYENNSDNKLSCREIYKKEGKDFFRKLEKKACLSLDRRNWSVISTGGSAFLDPEIRRALRKDSIVILLTADSKILWDRIIKKGIPAYLKDENDPYNSFKERKNYYEEVVIPFSDIISDSTHSSVDENIDEIYQKINNEIELRMYSPNTFGDILRVTTFGESHNHAMGVVIDGMPPKIDISEKIIMKQLKRRKPGQSRITTSRKEKDEIRILSGVLNGKSTGAPIAMIVENKDVDSSKYDKLKDIFRPGHADYGYFMKFGIRDHRGGGRSSGRETVSRVAAGAIAIEELKKKGINIIAYAKQIGKIKAQSIDYDFIEKNPVRCPDPKKADKMQNYILNASKEDDSTGGVVEIIIEGVPAGLGDPVFFKLDSKLASAFFSIGAVKGVEFGAGFLASVLRGSENNDWMEDGKFLTNNSGGILGGISNGEKIKASIAIKPTPSISKEQKTSDINGKNKKLKIEGRHDPNIVPRIIPVVESMAALVIFDSLLIQERAYSNN